jgi:hypothetical protein
VLPGGERERGQRRERQEDEDPARHRGQV